MNSTHLNNKHGNKPECLVCHIHWALLLKLKKSSFVGNPSLSAEERHIFQKCINSMPPEVYQFTWLPYPNPQFLLTIGEVFNHQIQELGVVLPGPYSILADMVQSRALKGEFTDGLTNGRLLHSY